MNFSHTKSAAVPAAAIEGLGIQLTPYLTHLRRVVEQGGYAAPECSLCVPGDEYMHTAVETIVDRVYSGDLRYIFLIGIGGSNLGAMAIYQAMAAARDVAPHTHPRLITVDTTDSEMLHVVKSLITKANSADELLFIICSKSGTTTETIFNAEVLLAHFAIRFGRKARRVVVLSEAGSPLLAAATAQQMHTIALPPNLGGRYSVLSPVGLLPLALLGFSPKAIREVAEVAVTRSLHPDVTQNPAALIALSQLYFYQEGYRTHDTFLFAPALETMGKWYRQLLAESIGKTVNGDATRRVGITPTVTIGSTDLHSVGQLYLGGPRGRLTTFVRVTKLGHPVTMPPERAWPEVVPALTNQAADTVLGAIYEGTLAAYDHNHLPYLTIEFPEISPTVIAEYMQYQMAATMMLGYLLQVNPFDQPHVEEYKVVTKRILGT